MATQPKSRRRPRKLILVNRDGALFDASEDRPMVHADLRDHLRDGGLFEARRSDSGADCTYEVLQDLIEASALPSMVPGLGGASFPGFGAVPGLVNRSRRARPDGRRRDAHPWSEEPGS